MLASVQYHGGKNGAGVYQKLINLMPPHDVYIEPFLGSGAVMRLKRPASLNIGMDLVASAVAEVGSAIVESGVSRSRIAWRGDPAGVLATFREDRRRPSPQWWMGSADGLRFLEEASLDRTCLVYCDPPYVMSSRRKHAPAYGHEFALVDHRRLLRAVRKLTCRVMISGYDSTLYSTILQDWTRIEFEAMTRRGLATEVVWFNYPRPTELHDYRYLGENFRERERIKRKTARWTARLARMPLLEKQAILGALAGTKQ